jgi:hypothetical protein
MKVEHRRANREKLVKDTMAGLTPGSETEAIA